MPGLPIPAYDPAVVCGLPKTLADDDLFEPTMVMVVLSNESAEDASFSVPRALICGRSQYFKSAFQGGFVEEDLKTTRIDDVPVWVFKTFIKWLYTQRLTLQPSTQVHEVAPVCGSKRKRSPTDAQDSEQDRDQPAKRQQVAPGEARDSTKQDASVSKQPAKKSTPNILTTYGRGFEEEEADGSVPANAVNAPDEEDLENPITCSFRALFELYLFADKYNSLEFRKLVLEHIQLKTQITHPRPYLPPSKEDTKLVVSRLPRSDCLFVFLAALWARHVAFSLSCETRGEAANLLEEFLQCPGGDECDGMDHCDADINGPYSALECSYHEHSSTDDRKQCEDKWVRLSQWCREIGRD